jgi:hypothetical protein
LNATLTDSRPAYVVKRRYTVCEANCSPALNSVDGNCGVLGELGKCCVSRQSAACLR